jgi:dTDP-4-amino-4,6-dideoxygalactose transaminase
LDPDKVEAAITPKTTAIMPVHVYGNPCNLDKFKKIADNYGLKLIYDAAHAFGVKINGNSVLNYGDLSILSFHATKVFNTIEGGAIISPDLDTKRRIDNLKNFGFLNETTVIAPGINAKMNEIQSAFGLLQLKYVESYIEKRKKISQYYTNGLKNIEGISLIEENPDVRYNYSYFPILVDNSRYGLTRNQLFEKLRGHNIYSRRYFYPLISQFPTYSGLESAKPENLVVASKISEEIICLPIFPDLDEETQYKIVTLISEKSI